jgi:hypothetical protein
VNGHNVKSAQTSVSKLRRGSNLVISASSAGGSTSKCTPINRFVPTGQIRALGGPFQNDRRPRSAKHGPTRSALEAHLYDSVPPSSVAQPARAIAKHQSVAESRRNQSTTFRGIIDKQPNAVALSRPRRRSRGKQASSSGSAPTACWAAARPSLRCSWQA